MTLSYLGSKKTLLPTLDKIIGKYIDHTTVFCDLFAGTGVVARFYRHRAKKVIVNDIELYSYIINKAYLQCSYTPKLATIIDSINHSILHGQPSKGLVYKYYAPNSKNTRKFFTPQNAMMIDGVRIMIHKLYTQKMLTYREYIFLMASLIYSGSKVSNNAGTYRAYLKSYCQRAIHRFQLVPIHKDHHTKMDVQKCTVLKQDALVVVSQNVFDVIYIDMPYTNVHYGGAYAFYNYLTMYDAKIVPVGVAGITPDYHKSTYGLAATARTSFEKLVRSIRSKYIIMSYNMDGVMKKHDILNILSYKGSTTLYKFYNKKYKPNANVKKLHVEEYIFVTECGAPGSHKRHEWVEEWLY
jgi:adenine-specific DNA-methyltransferase